MKKHLLGSSLIPAALWAVWLSVLAAGQPPAEKLASYGGCPPPPGFHACALEKAKAFSPPRTPEGKPDLQGYWRGREQMGNFSIEAITEDEPLTRSPVMPWSVGPGLIVDPPDGKIPYQAWAAPIGRKGENFKKYIDPRTACGSGGVPRLLGDLSLIMQPPGEEVVVMLFEDQNVYRVIPTDGRPHIGKNIELTNGDSVGRWEGNTLVVDVTNFNGHNWLDDSANFYTNAAHVVERITMIDPNTIHFQATIEDPKAYTRAWTMAWPIVRETQPGFEFLEEACREGERDVASFRKLGYKYYLGKSWRSR